MRELRSVPGGRERFIPTSVGNAEECPERGPKRRFIPTPVGNAASCSARIRATSVHPHARGECGRMAIAPACGPGSSPRPWGMHIDIISQYIYLRFIPTPVGNALVDISNDRLCAVHPHARGECGSTGFSRTAHAGSSPRPWGMLNASTALLQALRFIPTPVGNA